MPEPIKRLLNNDIERFKKPFNINDIEKKDPYYADKTADWLVSELGSSSSRPYYCKLARKISKHKLRELLVIAKERGKYPDRLFTHLTQKHLRNMELKNEL